MNANELLDLIKQRRVVRRFDPGRAIEESALRRVLEAAIWAPFSVYAPQQWKFIATRGAERDAVTDIVSKDRTVLKYVRLMYEQAKYGGGDEAKWSAAAQEFGKTLGGAPVVVVALVHQDPHGARFLHNTAAAWLGGENMMLQAQAEGLASGVVSLMSPKVQVHLVEHLGLDADEWAPAFVMNLGYAAETPEATPRDTTAIEVRG
jgi:nitroreductase